MKNKHVHKRCLFHFLRILKKIPSEQVWLPKPTKKCDECVFRQQKTHSEDVYMYIYYIII